RPAIAGRMILRLDPVVPPSRQTHPTLLTEQRTALSGGEHPENVHATLRTERRARLAAERRFRIAAEDAERLVTSALSALGHELRPPLAHALDFVARLEGANALPTSAIADVARGLHSALQVVDDILESSQLEEG